MREHPQRAGPQDPRTTRRSGDMGRVEASANHDSSDGQCVDCGVDIACARLPVAPEVSRGIACQEKVE